MLGECRLCLKFELRFYGVSLSLLNFASQISVPSCTVFVQTFEVTRIILYYFPRYVCIRHLVRNPIWLRHTKPIFGIGLEWRNIAMLDNNNSACSLTGDSHNNNRLTEIWEFRKELCLAKNLHLKRFYLKWIRCYTTFELLTCLTISSQFLLILFLDTLYMPSLSQNK